MRTKIAVSAIAAILLAGCNTIPRATPSLPSKQESLTKLTRDWSEPSVVKEGKPMIVLLTPTTLPDAIRNKKISVELEPATTVKDIVAVMAELGYSIVLADREAGDKDFWIPKYSGTLGGLVSSIQKATDVFFLWDNGTIIVTSKEKVSVGIPQDKTVIDKITAGLKEVGITGISSSVEAGFLSFDVKPSQLNQVRKFLDRITNNAAMVTMQVGIVTVNLSRDLKQGIDWSSLNVAIGSGTQSMVTGAGTTATPTPLPSTTSLATTTTTGVAATAANLKNFAQFTSSVLKGQLVSNDISMSALVNALDKFGETDTLQNVMLKTVTGNKVKLKSVTQIPYVTGVGVTTTPTATTSTSTASNSVMGSARTSTANDGITLNIMPMYDAQADMVTLDMDLSIQSVISFNTLSAGNQIGNLSQPTTGDRSFNDIIRMRPGQTVIVGGVIYDSVTDDRVGIPGITSKTNTGTSLSVKKQEMFIVIKPTVTAFGSLEEHESTELFPTAAYTEKKQSTKRAVKSDEKVAK